MAEGLIIADAPGHEQYTRNMAVAASRADIALVLVDATRGIRTTDSSPSNYLLAHGRHKDRSCDQQA